MASHKRRAKRTLLGLYEEEWRAQRIGPDELADSLGPWLRQQPNLDALLAEVSDSFRGMLMRDVVRPEAIGDVIRRDRPRDLLYNLRQAFCDELRLAYDPQEDSLTRVECRVLETDVDNGRRVVAAMWYAVEPTQEYLGAAYLDAIHVVREFRGRGYGRKLIDYLDGELPEDVDGIVLFAPRSALGFYSVLGFNDTGHATTPLGIFDASTRNPRLFRLYRAKARTP